MPSAGPLKKFMSWLNAEDEEEEFDSMESPPSTPAATVAPPASKRQRGPLTLHNSEGGMEIRHPRSLEDRMAIGMDLKQRRMVTLDLTKLPDADARYFLEFVYGVVYALDATAEKVTEGIYLLAPRGVSVRNDQEMIETTSQKSAFTASHTSGNVQEELFWQVR